MLENLPLRQFNSTICQIAVQTFSDNVNSKLTIVHHWTNTWGLIRVKPSRIIYI